MDSYVDTFMEHGGSFISLAKGNRSRAVTNACKKHGGFYLGSIGGPAAILAQNCIKDVKVQVALKKICNTTIINLEFIDFKFQKTMDWIKFELN